MDNMRRYNMVNYEYSCGYDDRDYDWDYYEDDYEDNYDKDYDCDYEDDYDFDYDYEDDYDKKDGKKDNKKDNRKDDKKDDKDKDKCKSSTKIHFNPCELCKAVDTEPVDLGNCLERDLKAKIVLKNVCFNRKFKVKVALLDKSGKVIETKEFKAILRKNKKSHSDKGCGVFKKEVKFDLPKNKVCHTLDFTIKVSAEYVDKC
ncbi:hypothetical protein [Clostridium isatidis]|uniref:Uncharacterized protein n=1 Tax=Clostridium isatidis TaxID=182773 RepID=A0A343JF44_9CLOT|nr:hypothetical protein [Clostridium isatidis]ASW44152.1 hypothetical protein BEN51_11990 [Clostridium isatidis]NLZ34819.1 hypothetical protein [Clostridiales bacterium]